MISGSNHMGWLRLRSCLVFCGLADNLPFENFRSILLLVFEFYHFVFHFFRFSLTNHFPTYMASEPET
jgi:hypothetical protein